MAVVCTMILLLFGMMKWQFLVKLGQREALFIGCIFAMCQLFFYLSMMALVGGQFSFVFLCCAKFHACKSKMDIVVMSIFGSGMQCRCSLAWPFVAVCVLSC
mmetsp:Transcript_109699/g.186550  ORF Transcript_109699/g.186550 Transcript_109699/m.186550 type:complete len:102 (-) Transcript_109699:193-498(-)